jgi:hypothetical protein
MVWDSKSINDRIRDVILRESELPVSDADHVAFHMTDWLEDLANFAQFCAEPDQWNDKEAQDMLVAFLIHVPNHVAAAAKILTGIPVTDIFGVGAVDPVEGSN